MSSGVRAVQIDGLRALQKDLRTLDKKLPAELRKVNLAVAQMVVTKAQATAQGQGGVAAKAAPAIKAAAEQRGASVTLKASARIPFAMGAEFGAGHNAPRHRGIRTYQGFNQFKAWKGNSTDAGYFMYPTIRGEIDNGHVVDAYEKRLAELLGQIFTE